MPTESYKFKRTEKVAASDGNLLFEARVQRRRKTEDGSSEYLIKWKNYPESHNQWLDENQVHSWDSETQKRCEKDKRFQEDVWSQKKKKAPKPRQRASRKRSKTEAETTDSKQNNDSENEGMSVAQSETEEKLPVSELNLTVNLTAKLRQNLAAQQKYLGERSGVKVTLPKDESKTVKAIMDSVLKAVVKENHNDENDKTVKMHSDVFTAFQKLFVVAMRNCLWLRSEFVEMDALRQKDSDYLLQHFGAEHLLRFLAKLKPFLVDYLKSEWTATAIEAAHIRQAASSVVRYLDTQYATLFEDLDQLAKACQKS